MSKNNILLLNWTSSSSCFPLIETYGMLCKKRRSQQSTETVSVLRARLEEMQLYFIIWMIYRYQLTRSNTFLCIFTLFFHLLIEYLIFYFFLLHKIQYSISKVNIHYKFNNICFFNLSNNRVRLAKEHVFIHFIKQDSDLLKLC